MTILLLRIPYVNMQFPYLTGQLRAACEMFEPADADETHFLAWTLLIGFIAVFDHNERRLAERLCGLGHACSWSSWVQAKDRLQRVMWIDFIHDGPGREVFERIFWGVSTVQAGERSPFRHTQAPICPSPVLTIELSWTLNKLSTRADYDLHRRHLNATT